MKTSLQSIFGPTQRYFVLYPQFEGITLHFQFCYPYFFVDFLENIGFQGMESKKKPRENIQSAKKFQLLLGGVNFPYAANLSIIPFTFSHTLFSGQNKIKSVLKESDLFLVSFWKLTSCKTSSLKKV